MQKRDIEFLFFWPKRPLKSNFLRFFLQIRFFLQKPFKIIDFLSFFLVGRTAVRPLAFCRILGVFFFPFFHELHLQIAFFKLRYMTFFSCMLRLLEPLISYFDSREKFYVPFLRSTSTPFLLTLRRF